MEATSAGQADRLTELLAPLRADPAGAAILTDVDGTIAPIVERPEDAAVPDRVRELLASLAETYALVGCISGRGVLDAKRMVGLDQLAYSGNHGYELLLAGESVAHNDPQLDGHEEDARRYVAGIASEELADLGIRVEDKGAILALHWRGSANEGEAEAWASERANDAEWNGLVAHRGRMVLEIRPDVSIDKGKALASLLNGREISAALYAGDDSTDLDAFRALTQMRSSGALEATALIAIASDEAPPEVAAAGDLVVEGPEGFLAVLEHLDAG